MKFLDSKPCLSGSLKCPILPGEKRNITISIKSPKRIPNGVNI